MPSNAVEWSPTLSLNAPSPSEFFLELTEIVVARLIVLALSNKLETIQFSSCSLEDLTNNSFRVDVPNPISPIFDLISMIIHFPQAGDHSAPTIGSLEL